MKGQQLFCFTPRTVLYESAQRGKKEDERRPAVAAYFSHKTTLLQQHLHSKIGPATIQIFLLPKTAPAAYLSHRTATRSTPLFGRRLPLLSSFPRMEGTADQRMPKITALSNLPKIEEPVPSMERGGAGVKGFIYTTYMYPARTLLQGAHSECSKFHMSKTTVTRRKTFSPCSLE